MIKIKKNIISGIVKSKILNTNVKFNFDYDNKSLKIYNSYLRNKNLSFNNFSLITFSPYLEISNNLNIEEFNQEIIKKLDIYNFLNSKIL